MSIWYLLDSGPCDPATNMATDEASLEAMPRLGTPVLRFYGWAVPAASFGYFQAFTTVSRLTSLRPLVRRPSAGGLVPHDADWTYSLAVPVTADWYSLTAIESYKRIHEWLRDAFKLMNVQTELAPDSEKAGSGQCFAGHEKFDLLWHGRKIAGAAQRRRLDGLLIQGSIQPPPGLARVDWQRAMRDVAASAAGIDWRSWQADAELAGRARNLAGSKYSQAAYNERR